MSSQGRLGWGPVGLRLCYTASFCEHWALIYTILTKSLMSARSGLMARRESLAQRDAEQPGQRGLPDCHQAPAVGVLCCLNSGLASAHANRGP